jgi:hypothetical protein
VRSCSPARRCTRSATTAATTGRPSRWPPTCSAACCR